MSKGRKVSPPGTLEGEVKTVKKIVRLLWAYTPQGRWNILKAVDEILVQKTIGLKEKKRENNECVKTKLDIS